MIDIEYYIDLSIGIGLVIFIITGWFLFMKYDIERLKLKRLKKMKKYNATKWKNPWE